MSLEDNLFIVKDLYRAKIKQLEEKRKTAEKSQVPIIDKQLQHYRPLYARSLVRALAYVLTR